MSGDRRTLLLVALAALVVLTIGDQLLTNLYDAPLSAAQRKTERLTRDIEKAQQTLKRFNKEKAQLKQLRNVSLPDDIEAARTLYQGWLNELAERIALDGKRVDSNPPRLYSGYRVLPFSLRCQGTLEQFTALLFEFYRAPYLHHIRTLTITPVAGTRELSLNLALEAISIEGSRQSATPPSGSSDQLASENLSDYHAILRRNVFSASGGVQAGQFTALTAIVAVDGYAEAWFTNALESEVQKVREGESFHVGALQCEVEQIAVRDLILVVENQRWLMTVDDTLADAIALPPEY